MNYPYREIKGWAIFGVSSRRDESRLYKWSICRIVFSNANTLGLSIDFFSLRPSLTRRYAMAFLAVR
ncbi:MAG: hypothetical protein RMZ41_024215 [Nostoc sp. DedVER02]|uniref:hypothetical protein n=1 Tax=unclassified Nostoc TaxID=2593658 RepID=UPI002AD535A6|nr:MULTISPECIES: hypothetical protein [unclassified Nostoc]MDZ7984641.1 hypothetical protein [Nostoc sp. DedVER02]MDZ8111234.1 hypothetical protein [Nostoc sp. DedVER01b]